MAQVPKQGQLFPAGDIGQCLWTFLFVMTGDKCSWYQLSRDYSSVNLLVSMGSPMDVASSGVSGAKAEKSGGDGVGHAMTGAVGTGN